MKVLVTGGAGFIGSDLVHKLVEKGHDVTVLDILKFGNKLERKIIQSIHLLEGDVRNESDVLKAAENCEIIYHYAAILGVDIVADNPVEAMETETIGLKNVAKAAIKYGSEKIIYASTSGIYGRNAIEKAVKEDFDVSPKSSYSIAKRYNEIYLAALFAEKNIGSIALRFFNVYGPKQDSRMVIPRFFNQALNSQPLTVYGDGNQTRDFTYIDDVTEAAIQLSTKGKGHQILNVSNNKEYSIKQLAENIVSICNPEVKIDYIQPPSNRYDFEVERRFGSSDKLFTLIGFKPDTPLEKGLKKIYKSKMLNLE